MTEIAEQFVPGKWYLSAGTTVFTVVENTKGSRAMREAAPFINRLSFQVQAANGEATDQEARELAERLTTYLNEPASTAPTEGSRPGKRTAYNGPVPSELFHLVAAGLECNAGSVRRHAMNLLDEYIAARNKQGIAELRQALSAPTEGSRPDKARAERIFDEVRSVLTYDGNGGNDDELVKRFDELTEELLAALSTSPASAAPVVTGGGAAEALAAAEDALTDAESYSLSGNYQGAYLKARNGLRRVKKSLAAAAPQEKGSRHA